MALWAKLLNHIYENAWIFGILEIYLPFYIICITRTNELINSYVYFVYLVYFLVTYVVLENLSEVMTLRRKETAKDKAPEELSDFEVEFDDPCVKFRSVQVPHSSFKDTWQILWHNFKQFSECYYAYKVVSKVGLGFIVAAFIMFILNLSNGNNSSSSFYAILLLTGLGITFLVAVFLVVDNRKMFAKEVEHYVPFDETVNVPMKILVGKIFAAYLTGRFIHIIQLPIGVCFLVSGLDILQNMTEISGEVTQLLQSRLPATAIDIIFHVITLIIIYIGTHLIYRSIKKSYRIAKQSLLVTMELNWQRNLHAIKYLLPELQVSSLDELKTHLEDKQQNPSPKDINVFFYISLPLWIPKRGFFQAEEW